MRPPDLDLPPASRHRWRSMSAGFLLALSALIAWPSARAQSPPSADEQRALALRRASDAVIGLEAQAVTDATSAESLGRERSGSGIVIGSDGLVLTIGYLIVEADSIDLVLDDGRRVPARPVAYDLATGFGLVQSLVPLPIEAVPLGSSRDVKDTDQLLVASGGSDGAVSVAHLVSRRSFSAYWEYAIDDALFTEPPRRDQGGAGLFNSRGELLGVGSLFVMDAREHGERSPGNMFVPVDLLKPIIGELREHGSSTASHRAWLGVYCSELAGTVRVQRVASNSPASRGGLAEGDQIRTVDGAEVHDLASFYRELWSGGEAERDVRLGIVRDDHPLELSLHSVDRNRILRMPSGI